MMNVYIVPGFEASPESHWFNWLNNQVQQQGATCETIAWTDSSQPDLALWNADLKQQLTRLNTETVIIAHSLGCLATLNTLSEQLNVNNTKIKAIFWVAGFHENLLTLPELNTFIQQSRVEQGLLRTYIQQRYVFFSTNDRFVPAPLSIRFGHSLNAQMIEVKQAGHFTSSDGYNEFPQLWDYLKPILSHSN